MSDLKFVNPYNFVKLATNKSTSKLERGNLTGYLDVSIQTKTPIFIPNTTNEHYFKNDFDSRLEKSYDFYSYEDLKEKTDTKTLYSPVIPSSEIRGAIRSIFEAINNCCLSSIDLEERFFDRTKDSDGKSCIIRRGENNNYTIHQVKSSKNIEYTNDVDIKDGKRFITHNGKDFYNYSEVYWNQYENTISYGKDQNKANGILVIAERNPNGNCGAKVFMLPKDSGEPFNDIALLEELLKTHRDDKINNKLMVDQKLTDEKDHTGYIDLDLKATYIPVYKLSNGKISFAKRGKYVLHNQVKDVIKDYAPCSSEENLCDACSIFGFIDKGEEKNSLTSRVRFTDGITSNDLSECYMEPFIVQPMLSPHISNAAFYSAKSTLEITNYDDINTVIRGRKFYLHHKPLEKNYKLTDQEFYRLTKAMRPVKENVDFTSKIYFENLTEEQLKKLIYSIELMDENHGHKIGACKPLGFGSIKMEVNDCVLRKLTLENGKIEYRFEGIELGKPKYNFLQLNDIEFLTRFNPFDDKNVNVTYPPGGFEWFTNNLNNPNNATAYIQLLSSIEQLKNNEFLKDNEPSANNPTKTSSSSKHQGSYSSKNYNHSHKSGNYSNNGNGSKSKQNDKNAPKEKKGFFKTKW